MREVEEPHGICEHLLGASGGEEAGRTGFQTTHAPPHNRVMLRPILHIRANDCLWWKQNLILGLDSGVEGRGVGEGG